MDELIRKKDAIDAVFSEPLYKSGMKKRYADVVVPAIYEKIKSLPPVQPTITHEQAIDYLHETGWLQNHDRILTESKIVPSAQPERTCVNCGRTANNGGWYADGGTRCPIEEHYALPKDGYCHLWEKRNVTDDDYPERRTDDRSD